MKKNSMKKITFFITIIFVVNSLAQINYKSCPPVFPMINFNVNGILGKWYEIQRYSNEYELNDKCITYNYAQDNNSQSTRINIRGINMYSGSRLYLEAHAVPIANHSFEANRIVLSKYAEPADLVEVVLDTDYNNYLVEVGCQVINDSSIVYAWIESRSKKLHHKYLKRAYQVLNYNSIPLAELEIVEQKSCPD